MRFFDKLPHQASKHIAVILILYYYFYIIFIYGFTADGREFSPWQYGFRKKTTANVFTNTCPVHMLTLFMSFTILKAVREHIPRITAMNFVFPRAILYASVRGHITLCAEWFPNALLYALTTAIFRRILRRTLGCALTK